MNPSRARKATQVCEFIRAYQKLTKGSNPSLRLIADACGVSVPTARKRVHSACRGGMLKIEAGALGKAASRYVVLTHVQQGLALSDGDA